MAEFPQFFYQRVNGSLVCKKVLDAASAEQLRRQGFKFLVSGELVSVVSARSCRRRVENDTSKFESRSVILASYNGIE